MSKTLVALLALAMSATALPLASAFCCIGGGGIVHTGPDYGVYFDPGCGCACPVVGAVGGVAAAGQRVNFVAATALVYCGDIALVSPTTGPVDPKGQTSVTVTPILGGGAIAQGLLA